MEEDWGWALIGGEYTNLHSNPQKMLMEHTFVDAAVGRGHYIRLSSVSYGTYGYTRPTVGMKSHPKDVSG
jgi:hypothetical protein